MAKITKKQQKRAELAIKMAADIFNEYWSTTKDKKAHPHCRRFRRVCWLPHPQPECRECSHLPLEDALKDIA